MGKVSQVNIWSEEDDNVLREDALNNVPLSQTALKLGRNKNSVSGRRSRLGLKYNQSQLAAIRSAPRGPQTSAAPFNKPAVSREYILSKPSLADLPDKGCKFPIGEGLGPRDHRFCGELRGEGRNYCDHHHSMCYYKPSLKQKEAA